MDGDGDGDGHDSGRARHENIIHLKEVAVGSNSSAIFLVFEFVHFDLAKLVEEHFNKYARSPFTLVETKCLALQLLSDLEFLHARCIVHRDLKLSNLLYCKDRGMLKLAGFGLARKVSASSVSSMSMSMSMSSSNRKRKSMIVDSSMSMLLPASPPAEPLTPKVVSLWYRPPELLLEAESFT
eukprot:912291_1